MAEPSTPETSETSETTDATTSGPRLSPTRRKRGRRTGWQATAQRYAPVAVAVALVVAVLVVNRGGGDDGGGSGGQTATGATTVDREALIRSGPMTAERARLENASVSFGPECDVNLGRIALPTVYAPPCVVPFEGDNGGATSQGVTAGTVKVVAYLRNLGQLEQGLAEDAGTNLDRQRDTETIQRLTDVYNRVFETYGRQVEVEVFEGTGAAADTQAARADAIAIAERRPFAVIGGPDQASPVFADELAARGVVCLEGCAVGLPHSFLAERAPYVWMGGAVTDDPPIEAEAIGKLAGPGKAERAGDRELREQDRVYGVVHYDTPDGLQQENYERLVDALADNGIEVTTDAEYQLDVNRMQETARTTISKLKADGVTTVIFAGDFYTPTTLTAEATAQDYFPEWIVTPANYLVGEERWARGYDQRQWENMLGIISDDAAAEGLDVWDDIYQWAYGTTPPSDVAGGYDRPLRALFTGIHLAGEHLTPETFRDGLYRYPRSGGGPARPTLSYAEVGDTALVWWDPEAEGLDENGTPGRGMYRYARGGQRYGPGELPDSLEEAGLWDVEASIVEYDQLPEQDRTPDYPPPEGL